MTTKKKSLFRRIASAIVAMAITVTTLCTNIVAEALSYEAETILAVNYTGGKLNSSSPWGEQQFMKLWVNGRDYAGVCIEPNTRALRNDKYVLDSKNDYYNGLSVNQRWALGYVFYYGYPNASTSDTYFDASQLLAWEIVSGYRDFDTEDFTAIKDCSKSLLNYYESSYSEDTKKAYNNIINKISKHKVKTNGSFDTKVLAEKNVYTLKYNKSRQRYEVIIRANIADWNDFGWTNVLRDMGLGVASTPVSSTVKDYCIYSETPFTTKKVASATKASTNKGSFEKVVIYANSTVKKGQAIAWGANFDPVSAYMAFEAPRAVGDFTLTKLLNNGKSITALDNWDEIRTDLIRFYVSTSPTPKTSGTILRFTGDEETGYVYNSSTGYTLTYGDENDSSSIKTLLYLNEDAKLMLKSLPYGTYYIYEIGKTGLNWNDFGLVEPPSTSKVKVVISGASNGTALTNTEYIPNSLTISKDFVLWADEEVSDEIYTDLTFNVLTEDGKYIDVEYISEGTSDEDIEADAKSGVYKYKGVSDTPVDIKLGTESKTAQIVNLPNGKYSVKEVYDNNIFKATGDGVIDVEIDSAVADKKDAYADFTNTEYMGELVLRKLTQTGRNIEGIQFSIVGTTALGTPVDITTDGTDANGEERVILPVGDYEISEIVDDNLTDAYFFPEPQQITVTKDNITALVVEFENVEKYGSLEVSKESSSGIKLEGAVFGIYANEDIYQGFEKPENLIWTKGEKIVELTTTATDTVSTDGKVSKLDVNGKEITGLLYGKEYKVVELTAPLGWNNDGGVHTGILREGQNGEADYLEYASGETESVVKFVNTQATILVEIEKVDSVNNNIKLEGAVFDVIATSDIYVEGEFVEQGTVLDTLTTNAEGKASTEVPCSTYLAEHSFALVEKTAPVGYNKIDGEIDLGVIGYTATTITKQITEEQQPLSLEIYKADSVSKLPIPNVSFGIYADEDIYRGLNKEELVYAKDELIGTITTDANGYATTEGLYALYTGFGYYAKEVEGNGNKYYFVDGKKIIFENTGYDAEKDSVTDSQNKENTPQGLTLDIFKVDEEDNTVLLEGAEFDIFANEDVVIGGQLIWSKDDLITHVVVNGNAQVDGLYNGFEYKLVETKAPEGYSIKEDGILVSSAWENTSVEYVTTTVTVENQKGTFDFDIPNDDEEDDTTISDSGTGDLDVPDDNNGSPQTSDTLPSANYLIFAIVLCIALIKKR